MNAFNCYSTPISPANRKPCPQTRPFHSPIPKSRLLAFGGGEAMVASNLFGGKMRDGSVGAPKIRSPLPTLQYTVATCHSTQSPGTHLSPWRPSWCIDQAPPMDIGTHSAQISQMTSCFILFLIFILIF